MITFERLRELFDYCDGNLIRKMNTGRGTGRWKVGQMVGSKTPNGYMLTSVDYKMHKVHRLIFMWHHGRMPTKAIDHIDGNPTNNRIENLREATDAENMQNNRKPRITNKLGSAGVYMVNSKFRVQVTLNGKQNHIGYFKTKEEAHLAYVEAKRRIHPFSTL